MKKRKDNEIDLTSILETNSAHVDESLLEGGKVKLTVHDRKRLWRVLIVTGIFLVIVAAVLVIGILVGQQHQARLEAMSARDELLYSYDGFVPEEGTVSVGLTQAFYSKENGMQLVLVIANETQVAEKITGLDIAIYNEADQLIAKGGYKQKKSWFSVAAGEEHVQELYLGPEYVFIQNDALTSLRTEVTVHYE